jgi:small subunit ribosomal protein S1
MAENEQPQPPTPPAADQPAPASPEPAAQAPETPAKAPDAPPAKPARPERRKPQGGGGNPRVRMREAIPTLMDDRQFGAGPKIKDLDDEIADELEAALGGMSEKDMFGVDSSRQVRSQAAGQADQGRKQGKVIAIHGPDVFIDVPGGRSQGVLPMLQFPDAPPKIGDTVDVSIEGYDPANGLLILSRQGAAVHADWATVAEGMVVEARVLETNKGGLAVDVNGIRGFMPISQIDLYRVEDATQFVNQRLLCVITEADPTERNLVVSRRALLERQREEQREKLWAEIAEGQVRTGVVRSVRDFGAFVDLGGADGLLHVSEMTWKRGANPSEILQPGQTVKVAVVKVDREQRKLSLSLKQLEASPWDEFREKYHPGQVIDGTVTRLMDFGAFVEIEPGIEGLIHISELARQRVRRVSDIVQVGQKVQARILSIDPEHQRISLSLKEAVQEPEATEEEPAEEAPAEPVKPRIKNPNLRGGIGGQTWQLPGAGDQGE